jgi:hypothetical protein
VFCVSSLNYPSKKHDHRHADDFEELSEIKAKYKNTSKLIYKALRYLTKKSE